jgi:hypothetical protein
VEERGELLGCWLEGAGLGSFAWELCRHFQQQGWLSEQQRGLRSVGVDAFNLTVSGSGVRQEGRGFESKSAFAYLLMLGVLGVLNRSRGLGRGD